MLLLLLLVQRFFNLGMFIIYGWEGAEKVFIRHLIPFLHEPPKRQQQTNGPPQVISKTFDPTSPTTALLLPFFHTTMKETTSYAYCTSPKTAIYPENGTT